MAAPSEHVLEITATSGAMWRICLHSGEVHMSLHFSFDLFLRSCMISFPLSKELEKWESALIAASKGLQHGGDSGGPSGGGGGGVMTIPQVR